MSSLDSRELLLAAQYCIANKPNQLRQLLETSVKPDDALSVYKYKTTRQKVPLLSIAISTDSLECAQLLLQSGANIEIEDGNGSRPIHWACLYDKLKMLNLLLDNGAQPNPMTDPSVTAPIIIVSKRGFVDCLERLLESGVSANYQDASGFSPLHLVCWHGHFKAIPILLRSGALVDLQDFNCNTPLHYGCWIGKEEVCTALLDAGASIDMQDQTGRTPLYFAVQHKHPEIVQLLLDHHANPSIQTCNGITPESLANQEGIVDIIEIFQKYFKEISEKGDDDENQFEKDFNDEHNKLKTAINKMVEGRDKQVEEFKNLREKLNEHDSALTMVQVSMKETLDQLNNIEQILKSVLITVNAMTEKPSPPSSSSTMNTNSQAGSNRSVPQLPLSLCKLCKKNQAAMRCKNCRSPVCNTCMAVVKANGCPFCLAMAAKEK